MSVCRYFVPQGCLASGTWVLLGLYVDVRLGMRAVPAFKFISVTALVRSTSRLVGTSLVDPTDRGFRNVWQVGRLKRSHVWLDDVHLPTVHLLPILCTY